MLIMLTMNVYSYRLFLSDSSTNDKSDKNNLWENKTSLTWDIIWNMNWKVETTEKFMQGSLISFKLSKFFVFVREIWAKTWNHDQL